MTIRVTGAVAARVLAQLRRDPRTLVLVIGVPCLLETLLQQLLAGRGDSFQHVGVPLLGLFPFATMFLVASVTMLRERVSGTLERLMTLPLAKLDLLLGYGAAFARTEFQAVQFMPAVVFPQVLLCGLFAPRGSMAAWLGWISDALPLTYAYDALAHTAAGTLGARFAADVAVVSGTVALALALGAATLRRRTA
jgi:ABC-2 type transport system permease protein